MADYFDAGKYGAICVVGPFTAANVTTGASNQDMVIGQSSDRVTMPMGGSVIGVAARSTEVIETAGTVTVRAHSASTEFADSGYPAPVLTTAATSSYATQRPGAVTFSAGDNLGLSLSSTTTLDPTNSLDVDAYLFVQFDPS